MAAPSTAASTKSRLPLARMLDGAAAPSRRQHDEPPGPLHPQPPERAHHRHAEDRLDVVAARHLREGELRIVDDQHRHVLEHIAGDLDPRGDADPRRDGGVDAVADRRLAAQHLDPQPPRGLGGEHGEIGAGVEHRLDRLAVHRHVDPGQADAVDPRGGAAGGDRRREALGGPSGEQGGEPPGPVGGRPLPRPSPAAASASASGRPWRVGGGIIAFREGGCW